MYVRRERGDAACVVRFRFAFVSDGCLVPRGGTARCGGDALWSLPYTHS